MSINVTSNNQSTVSLQTESTSTPSTPLLTQQPPLGEAKGVNPHTVFEGSQFHAESVSPAVAGHRTLSTPPPIPNDHVQLTPHTRRVANQAAEKYNDIGRAGVGSPMVAQAMAHNDASSYAVALAEVNERKTSSAPTTLEGNAQRARDTSFSQPSYSQPSYSSPSNTGSTGSTGLSPPPSFSTGSDTNLNDASKHLGDDAKANGSCGNPNLGAQMDFQSKVDQAGIPPDMGKWMYDQIRNSSDAANDPLAKAIVALDQMNPNDPQTQQYRDRIIGDVQTLQSTESSRMQTGAAGNQAANQWASAAQDIQTTLASLGLSASGADFGIGDTTGGNNQPTPGANGWTISPLNLQT